MQPLFFLAKKKTEIGECNMNAHKLSFGVCVMVCVRVC